MRIKKSVKYMAQLGWFLIVISMPVNQLPLSKCWEANAWGSEKKLSESETYPKRVISLGPIITENIYLLGAQDALIGNTTYCVIPQEAQTKEKVGSLIQMNVEKIIRLNPDLVLASSFTKSKQIKILEKFNIRVIKFDNAKTFDEMCAMTMRIGRLLGKRDAAQNIVNQAHKKVEKIVEQTAPLTKKKVFFQIGIKPLHTPIKGTFVNEYIKFAGGINIAEDAKSEKYSREKVLQLNPDVILIAMMGSSRKAAENEKKGWLRFKSINAAKNNEIYILDPDLVCSPTPVTFIEALDVIVTLLHHKL